MEFLNQGIKKEFELTDTQRENSQDLQEDFEHFYS